LLFLNIRKTKAPKSYRNKNS